MRVEWAAVIFYITSCGPNAGGDAARATASPYRNMGARHADASKAILLWTKATPRRGILHRPSLVGYDDPSLCSFPSPHWRRPRARAAVLPIVRGKSQSETSLDRIVPEIETSHNFLRYADQKRLDGAFFYRSARLRTNSTSSSSAQTATPSTACHTIAHEPTTKTGVKHVDSAISTARLAPGTARDEFTISVGDQPSLDADPSKPGDNLGYAAFGKVVEGMDVV